MADVPTMAITREWTMAGDSKDRAAAGADVAARPEVETSAILPVERPALHSDGVVCA